MFACELPLNGILRGAGVGGRWGTGLRKWARAGVTKQIPGESFFSFEARGAAGFPCDLSAAWRSAAQNGPVQHFRRQGNQRFTFHSPRPFVMTVKKSGPLVLENFSADEFHILCGGNDFRGGRRWTISFPLVNRGAAGRCLRQRLGCFLSLF